jgi:hypothetical protein
LDATVLSFGLGGGVRARGEEQRDRRCVSPRSSEMERRCAGDWCTGVDVGVRFNQHADEWTGIVGRRKHQRRL